MAVKSILVTGGLGFIGSHTCVALAQAGFRLTIVDNLSNAKRSVLDRIRGLAPGEIDFHEADIRDRPALDRAFGRAEVQAVIHFAGLKAVGESVAKPLLYYDNNVGGTVTLMQAMAAAGVRRLVFSSSATVYGEPVTLPITEDHPLSPQSPYGRTKLIIEQMLADEALADDGFRHVTLRYFNPIGAHPSGGLGEDPNGIPNNLLPFVSQVATGLRPAVRVFGRDYDTHDGTGVRDYIHVMDLASGHLAALRFLAAADTSITVNLGTGKGYSVLDVIRAFERASGRPIPVEMAPRRAGDVASCYAAPSLADRLLGWRAQLGIDEMCRDAWAWARESTGR